MLKKQPVFCLLVYNHEMEIPWKNSETQYGWGGRALHWTSVTLLVVLILTGDGFADLEASEHRSSLVATHVSWGLLFLLVMLARVYWRISNHNPVQSYSIRKWQKYSARSLHLTIYFVVISQSLVGILNLASSGEGLAFFSFFETAAFMQKNVALYELSKGLHYSLSIAIYPLFLVHISAAIYHQLFGVLDDD